MILLVASHSDLLLMDPKFLAERHQDERFLIVIQRNDFEERIVELLPSNVEFAVVSNIENKAENIDTFITEVRKATGKSEPRLVYLCSCTRLHCLILYLIYAKKAWFAHYQGSGYTSKGSMDDLSIRFLPYLSFLPLALRRYLIYKLGRMFYRLKRALKIIPSIKIILFNSTLRRYFDLSVLLNLLKHSGVRPDELCAHNEIGLSGLRRDYGAKDLKTSFLLTPRSPSPVCKNIYSIFSGINEIIVAPSQLFDSRLTNNDFKLAVMGWRRVVKLLNVYFPEKRISFKPHPRQILCKTRNDLVFDQLLESCELSLFTDKETMQIINSNYLIITDVSSLLNLCDLYNQTIISVQDRCLTGGFHFLWLLPQKFTESCMCFDTIDSLQAFILQ